MDNTSNEGILIIKPFKLHNASDVLLSGDVLLELDSVKVGEDGTIPYMNDSRISFNYITIQKFVGDKILLKILRNGQIMNIEVTLSTIPYLIPLHLYGVKEPSYFIFGGLVFVQVTVPYLKTKYGKDWSRKCPTKIKQCYYDEKENINDQIIVLSCVLAHDINVGYHKWSDNVLLECNNIKIDNLRTLTRVVDESKDEFINFKFWKHLRLVLNRKICINKNDEILKQQKIKFDRSKDLRNIDNDNADDVKEDIESNDVSIDTKSVDILTDIIHSFDK